MQATFLPHWSKRRWLQAAGAAALGSTLHTAQALPERTLQFPRDHGSHPDLRTEWWYITGYGKAEGRDIGFQITFFRTRNAAAQGMQSQFAAKQVLFAHAAVTDVQGKKLWHDQRIARAGFGIAQANEADMQLKLRNWTLERSAATGTYQVKVQARDFALDVQCAPSQPLLLQGKNGLSRKGPDASQASYYYSHPQLRVAGSITLGGQRIPLGAGNGNGAAPSAVAWLDHEWSDTLLHPDAIGWDWIGMNLFDGSALTAFQLRRKPPAHADPLATGNPALWTGGSFRATSSSGLQTFIASPGEVQFQALKGWTSPATGAKYPIEWLVRTPADYYTVKAVIPNQELDSRNATGIVYWEGSSDLFDSNGKHVGRGYLEMTGYVGALQI